MLYTILIIVLVLLLVGALPHWGYWGGGPSPYGFYPSSALAVVVVVILILLLLGHL